MDETRTCCSCATSKSLHEYAFRSKERGTRQWMCKDCSACYKREWYQRNRDHHRANVRQNRDRVATVNRRRFWEFLLTQRCIDCGESDPVVLDFDHLRDKRGSVAQMVVSGASWESVEAEIAKCEVRCANCHRRRTARDRGTYRATNGILIRKVMDDAAVYVA